MLTYDRQRSRKERALALAQERWGQGAAGLCQPQTREATAPPVDTSAAGLRRQIGLSLLLLVLVVAAILWVRWPAAQPLPVFELEVRGETGLG